MSLYELLVQVKGVHAGMKKELVHRHEWFEYGICYAVEAANDWNDDHRDQITEIAESWPEFSGYPSYPVPHPERGAIEGFNSSPINDFWNPDHPYGAARLRLLDFLIEQTDPSRVTEEIKDA